MDMRQLAKQQQGRESNVEENIIEIMGCDIT
jgi:hypothetical protein